MKTWSSNTGIKGDTPISSRLQDSLPVTDGGSGAGGHDKKGSPNWRTSWFRVRISKESWHWDHPLLVEGFGQKKGLEPTCIL